jgi:hypothetical protein
VTAVDAPIADAQDATYPWGEEPAVAAFLLGKGHNPFSEGAFEQIGNNDVASGNIQAADDIEWGGASSALAAATTSTDPWADIAPAGEIQAAVDMEWGGGSSAFAVATISADSWAEDTTAFANNTITSSDSWADNASAFASTNINTSDPWGAVDSDSSQALMATPASDGKYDADIIMSEVLDSSQDNSPLSVTTAPSPSPAEQSSIMDVKSPIIPDASTGINPERLAMLEAEDESEEDEVREKTFGGGKGGNSVQMPFNRLEMMKKY